MNDIRLTFASWPYDRIAALRNGTIKPAGIDLEFVPSHPGDTFLKMLGNREFDASEMSMSSLLMSKERDDPFVAIPIFTSRTFRHNGLFVTAGSGIERPEDLAGKRVGIPEYQITSVLWIRGILEHEYGVRPSDIEWHAERWGPGMHSHGSAVGFNPPPGVSLTTIPEQESQLSLLVKGELDAAFIIQELRSSICRSSLSEVPLEDGTIRRLFENYKEVELDYYQRTGLFPIMHTVAVKRELYEEHPWIAESLYEAFCAAKDSCYREIGEWELLSFPWIRETFEEQRRTMGDDPYPYGITANQKVIDTICQYSHEQGLTERLWAPEELFASELAGS